MKAIITAAILLFSTSLFAQEKDKSYHLDQEYKMNLGGKLTLRCSDAKVSITGSDRTTARVKIDREVITKGWVFSGRDEFRVDIKEIGGDLDIEETSQYSQSGVIGYYSEKYTIRVELPRGVSLNIKGDDGDYLINNIGGAISLNLDDADVSLSACTGNDFTFRIDDGDIVMDQGKGKLDIDADDADIRISQADFTSINADMDDGDLIIETSLADNGEYSLRSQDGLISLTVTKGGGHFDIRHDDARVLADENFREVERSETRTSLTLAKGNAKVDIHSDDARVRLARR